jgi:hypothetical protein
MQQVSELFDNRGIPMKSKAEFKTVGYFLNITLRFPNAAGAIIYRGQPDASWPLLPKAGRPECFDATWKKNEKEGYLPQDLGRFKAWRANAVAYCSALPEHDLECLAFAQHYGLATRLLDWSMNPLVALYFACESHPETEGAIFCYLPWMCVPDGTMKFEEINVVARYMPRPFDKRVAAQSGCFTYHPHPEVPITPSELPPQITSKLPPEIRSELKDLIVMSIPPGIKRTLLAQLSHIGINRKSLFPDLDGLSAHINWETINFAANN